MNDNKISDKFFIFWETKQFLSFVNPFDWLDLDFIEKFKTSIYLRNYIWNIFLYSSNINVIFLILKHNKIIRF